MSSPIRLALLVCHTPLPTVAAKYGEYPEVFLKFLGSTCPGDPPGFIMDAYDVVNAQEYPPEDLKYDGILITGSAASAYENIEWIKKLITYVASVIDHKPETKIVASCFGHQIVSIAMGAECVPNNGRWEVGPTEIRLTELGKKVFGRDTINIQHSHRDHVPSIPPSFHLIGSTPVTPNQGMIRFDPSSFAASESTPTKFSLKDIQVLTLQGHPEYTTDLVKLIVQARSANGVIDEATADDFYERESRQDDGRGVIANVIWQILGYEGKDKVE